MGHNGFEQFGHLFGRSCGDCVVRLIADLIEVASHIFHGQPRFVIALRPADEEACDVPGADREDLAGRWGIRRGRGTPPLEPPVQGRDGQGRGRMTSSTCAAATGSLSSATLLIDSWRSNEIEANDRLRYYGTGTGVQRADCWNTERTPHLATTPHSKPGNLAYGRFIGRIGALAVALGVGAAIANSPGIAAADDGGSTTSQGSSPDSGSPNSGPAARTSPSSESGTADTSSPTIGSSTAPATGTNSARSFRSSFGQTPDRLIRSRLSQTGRHPSSSGSSSAKGQQPAVHASPAAGASSDDEEKPGSTVGADSSPT